MNDPFQGLFQGSLQADAHAATRGPAVALVESVPEQLLTCTVMLWH